MKKTETVAKKPAKKAKHSTSDIEMKRHLINKYRALIAGRYQYDIVKLQKGFTGKINTKMVAHLRDYFLTYLYPEPQVREKLDAAFAELENYVMHPAKVWNILGNLTGAIFRFGFQFPMALKAGLTSLEAYTSAKHFENTLLRAALDNGYTIPLSDEEFYDCMTTIPKQDLEKFIGEVSDLFRSFTNTELLGKTISIMEDVLQRMESKPDIYGANEVEAIQLGLDIMQKGYDLFKEYDDDMKEKILELIATNEKQFLDSLYAAK